MSVFRHWPKLHEEIERDQYDTGVTYLQNSGEKIYGPAPPEFNDPEKPSDREAVKSRKGPHVGFMQGRVKFFNMLLRQVERCGIPMHWGNKVSEYYEDEAAELGGVVLEDGRKWEADIVVAAGKWSSVVWREPTQLISDNRWHQDPVRKTDCWLHARAKGQWPIHVSLRLFSKAYRRL